jgi:RNA 2',3'-cyclic 3'-phosphodiesterase
MTGLYFVPTLVCMRLFVGIPLKPALVEELSALSIRLRSSDDGLRWAAPESWHITLQFLGNTTEAKYECVTKRLRDVHAPGVPVRLEELGFFDRAGVFFAGVGLTPELVALQQLVVMANGKCGFVPETRPYHPHITLARVKGDGGGEVRGHGLRQLKRKVKDQPKFTQFVAEEFLLYESMLGRTGARYEVRERFPLNLN